MKSGRSPTFYAILLGTSALSLCKRRVKWLGFAEPHICLTGVCDADGGGVAGVGHVEPGALRPVRQGTRRRPGTVAHSAHLGARQLWTNKNVPINDWILRMCLCCFYLQNKCFSMWNFTSSGEFALNRSRYLAREMNQLRSIKINISLLIFMLNKLQRNPCLSMNGHVLFVGGNNY